MLLADFIKTGTSGLSDLYSEKEARSIILMLCVHVLGTKSYTHIVDPGFVVDSAKVAELEDDLARLRGFEPIQYILGEAEFCDHSFKVTRDVLIPRPETEQIVRSIIKDADRMNRMRSSYGKNAEPVKVLDLCTGSGCIAWSIAAAVPGAKVVAVDLSDEALAVAKSQAQRPSFKDKVQTAPVFVKADLLDAEQDFDYGMFDFVISNPPYLMEVERYSMKENVLNYEPDMALFAPNNDVLGVYRAIARWSQRFLLPGGRAMVEINELLGHETAEVFTGAGFSQVTVLRDIFEKDRFISYIK